MPRIEICLEKGVKPIHYGMAFYENGIEIGNVVIITFIGCINFFAYSIVTGECVSEYVDKCTGNESSTTGRNYKYFFKDSFGQKIFIE